MYPLAIPPQYGGSHPPMHHSSMYAGPLISPEGYPTAQSISHTDRQLLEQGRQYDLRPNMASFYINPHMTENNFSLRRTVIPPRSNPNSAGGLNLHSNVLNISSSHEHAFNPHPASVRQKHYYASHKQSSMNEEMLQEMTKMHLGYIETEDSPKKMEQRQKLEELILNFLSITPHQSKFAFREVLEILENTVSMSSRFDARKAACAFEALAQYASNLICQPWRKEFRQLKLYSGFWVHQISNNLISAESILQLMGYDPVYSKEQKNQFCGSSQPFLYAHTSVLDPDLISRLALDCMIAYCECQCLHKIRERLDSFDFGFSQILEFRQRYLGDIDCTVRHLTYNMKQNLHLSKQPETQRTKQPSCSPPPPLPSRYSSHGQATHDRPPLKSPSASNSNRQFAMPSDKIRFPDSAAESGKSYKSQTRAGPPNYEPPAASFRTEHWDRGFPEAYATTVPTARLIDLDSSIDGSSRARRLLPKAVNRKSSRAVSQDTDEIDYRSVTSSCQQLSPEVLKAATLEEHMEASLNLVNNATPARNGSRQGRQSVDNWDFVYQNLEEKGYSKDIGERGDILNELKRSGGCHVEGPSCPKTYNSSNHRKDKSKPLPITQALQQFTRNETAIDRMDVAGRNNHSSKGGSFGSDKHSASKRNSSYDNLAAVKFDSIADSENKLPPKKVNNNVAARDNRNEPREVSKTQQSEPREYLSSERRRPRQEEPGSKGASFEPWSCAVCTYLNTKLRSTCEMCHTSQFFGRDDTQLESGSNCSHCTLINQKGTTYCSACRNPLDACSTYI